MKSIILIILASAKLYSQDFTIASTYYLWLNPALRLNGTYLGIAGSMYVTTWNESRDGLRVTGAYYTGSTTSSSLTVGAFDRSEISLEIKNLISERSSLFAIVQIGRENSRRRYGTATSSFLVSTYDWFATFGVGKLVVANLSTTVRYSAGRSHEGIRLGLEYDF